MPQQTSAAVSVLYLDRLVAAAEVFESGNSNDAGINMLLGAGSSPGGARPKALVHDQQSDEHFLAKFPSIKDNVDVVRIEAATMNLAQKAGLNVPPTKLVLCGNRPVLLVKRFDIMPPGRKHMVSLQTLLKAGGYYLARYSDVLNLVRKVPSSGWGFLLSRAFPGLHYMSDIYESNMISLGWPFSLFVQKKSLIFPRTYHPPPAVSFEQLYIGGWFYLKRGDGFG